MNKKVVLGMSGGVDSSVAALILQKKGYEVYGFFMNCFGRKRYWPSGIDWKREEEDVRAICKSLGIQLFVVNCEDGYEQKIIKQMFKDYSSGLTPNPDILCNNVGKFPGLLKKAKEIGAEFIATGHYARVRQRLNSFELMMGRDKEKDQSYFLFGLGQEILKKVIFPVGNLTKSEVRMIARRNCFANWEKRSSRGICYLGKIDVKKFLHSRIKTKRGKVISPTGEVVGFHPGTPFFTIGERVREKNGFEIFDSYCRNIKNVKLFVADKRKNFLVVAPDGHSLLKTKKVFVKDFKFMSSDKIISKLKARVRHLGSLYSGCLSKEGSRWVFEFSRGQKGIADGQFIVFYRGSVLVAGGEIRRK